MKMDALLRIDQRELSRLLRVFRDRRDEAQSEVERRMQQRLKQRDPHGRYSDRPQPSIALHVDQLEHAGTEVVDVVMMTLSDLNLIAESYGIHPLMLHPLLSNRLGGASIHVESFDRFMEVPGEFGAGSCYRIPHVKLQGSEELAFVHLRLDGGGFSDRHSHPGDELIFCLTGTIQLRLENSGLWTILGAGDYAHFYAEQVHSAHNIGDDPAELFIIRFYQLESMGTRFRILADLKSKTRRGAHTARAVQELMSAVDPLMVASEDLPEIIDRFGLGRLLQMISEGNGISLRKLEEAGKKARLGFNRSKFHRLHNGDAPVTKKQLVALARTYGIHPMLLFDFLFPALRNAVVVRHSDNDFYQMPEDLVGVQGVKYFCPCRRLADSDISIAVIELDVGGKSPVNRHPGHELLLPLSDGTIAIRLGEGGETGVRLSGRGSKYAHYFSNQDHYVANAGDSKVRCLLLRFYEA